MTVTGEYRSSAWILSGVDGITRQFSFATDSDTSLVPERVIMLGVIWRWKAAKGLEYAEDFRTWDQERSRVSGHDVGNKVLNMSASGPPAGSWPGTITDLTDGNY